MVKQSLSDKLVSTSWLEENLDNPSIRIIEVSDTKNPSLYFNGHIPGAIYWPWKKSLWDRTMREFVSAKDFQKLMMKSGVAKNTMVIFYSNSCQFAHYAFWVCRMKGHSDAKILHGNRFLWEKEKRPIEKSIPTFKPSSYPNKPIDESSRIRREEVLSGLNNSNRVLLDVRTLEEYNGERVSPKWKEFDHGAERKGRIPGAKHLYYGELINEDQTIKNVNELRESFNKRGATPDREIVFYCRLSHRASMAWFVARFILGYKQVKVYDGSWTEWGSIVGFPIINESTI